MARFLVLFVFLCPLLASAGPVLARCGCPTDANAVAYCRSVETNACMRIRHNLENLRLILQRADDVSAAGEGIRQQIEALKSPADRDQLLQAFETSVCDLRLDDLPYPEKGKMIWKMGRVLETVWLKDSSQERIWRRNIRFLERLRKEVVLAGPCMVPESAQELEMSPGMREALAHDGYVKTVKSELNYRMRHGENELACHTHVQISDDEYDRIRAAFESFLGRRLRTRGQLETPAGRESQTEDRTTGSRPPDFRVDIDL